MKLKVPNCFKEKQNQPSYCNWAKCGNTEEWEVAQARVGPVHVSEDRESQGRVSCILAAHLLLSTCFLLIWFFSVVFKVPSGTSSAQVSKMLRSVPSKAIYTGLFKSCAWDHFPEWTGASQSLFFFSANSAGEVCAMFSLSFVFDLISSFETLRCNMFHFEWGKCKTVFPFYLCDFLNVFLKCILKGFLFCITALAMWLSWLSVYQILSSLKCGDEKLWNYSKIFVPWAQYCIVNIFNGMNFIPSAYVCKY